MEITGGSYVVSIPVYEGPMDLLLHLVSKNRIEIHDIPIHEITDQYLEYLNQAQTFNLELGSSFFTMAATLLLIKSRMLLPKRRQEDCPTGRRMNSVQSGELPGGGFAAPGVSWNGHWKNSSG